MRKTILSAIVLAGLAATSAAAQSIADAVVAELTAQGYTNIEIEVEVGKTKVEARMDNQKVEIYLDEGGNEVKRETYTVVSSASSGSSMSDDDDDHDDDHSSSHDNHDDDDDDDDSDHDDTHDDDHDSDHDGKGDDD